MSVVKRLLEAPASADQIYDGNLTAQEVLLQVCVVFEHGGSRDRIWLRNFYGSQASLIPMNRDGASNLYVRVDLCCAKYSCVEISLVMLKRRLMRLMLEYQLLDLCVIGYITVVVDTSRLIPGPTHDPAPSSNQDKL